mmetsp:Transcript_9275/g.42240  ORF Transcript_9275/g.42240 Transcript_9275/m.42240 type:complete len:227 (+) Transcript_9275:121-801(+)
MDSPAARVLVLGASGFIGKNICSFLKERQYAVSSLTSAQLNLLDTHAVNDFFATNGKFDLVVHSCAVGGSRVKEDDDSVFLKNVKMLDSVLGAKDRFERIVYFSSGAGLFAKESPYGFSKYINDKILSYEEKAYNFRVFGCFGPRELPTRFITRALDRVMTNLPVEVHQDRYFDFVYVEDLCQLVELVLRQPDDVPVRIKKDLCPALHEVTVLLFFPIELVTFFSA